MMTEQLSQDALNHLDVIHFEDRCGTPQSLTAADWLGEAVQLSDRLTAEQAAALSAHDGYRIDNSLTADHSAYVLEGADGWVLGVYADDPFSAR